MRRWAEKAEAVYSELVAVNTKLKNNWGVAKAYEGLIECSFLREKENLNVDKVLQLSDSSIKVFAFENSLNSLFTTLVRLAT